MCVFANGLPKPTTPLHLAHTRIPENAKAHSLLEADGLHHTVVEVLSRSFPVSDARLSRSLQLVLSAIARWAPALALMYKAGHALHDHRVPMTHMVPVQAVFPFVKLFNTSRLLAFEVSASVLLLWCRGWFRHSPSPPAKLLATISAVARTKLGCPGVARHAETLGTSVSALAWPLLFSLFSEALSGVEWLRLWDFFVCHPERPEFLTLAAVAVLRLQASQLLVCTDKVALRLVLRKVSPRLKAWRIVAHVRKLYAQVGAATIAGLRPDADHDSAARPQLSLAQEGRAPSQPWFLTTSNSASSSSRSGTTYRDFPQASQKCLNLRQQQLDGITRFQRSRAEHDQLVAMNQELENETVAALRQTDLEQRRLIDAMTKATFEAASTAKGTVDSVSTASAVISSTGPTATATRVKGTQDHRYDERELHKLRQTYEIAIAAQKEASRAITEQLHWAKTELLREEVRTSLPGVTTRERDTKIPYSFRELKALREHIQAGRP